jgi:hypothetical protein
MIRNRYQHCRGELIKINVHQQLAYPYSSPRTMIEMRSPVVIDISLIPKRLLKLLENCKLVGLSAGLYGTDVLPSNYSESLPTSK